jgi:hypothetical protein
MTNELEERVEHLERRLDAMERVFRAATGHDSNLLDDIASIHKVIAETPGMSQTGVCRAAHRRFGFLSRARVVEVLRSGAGRCWRIEAGAYNSLLYFPNHADRTHAEVARSRDVLTSCGKESERIAPADVVVKTSF